MHTTTKTASPKPSETIDRYAAEQQARVGSQSAPALLFADGSLPNECDKLVYLHYRPIGYISRLDYDDADGVHPDYHFTTDERVRGIHPPLDKLCGECAMDDNKREVSDYGNWDNLAAAVADVKAAIAAADPATIKKLFAAAPITNNSDDE